MRFRSIQFILMVGRGRSAPVPRAYIILCMNAELTPYDMKIVAIHTKFVVVRLRANGVPEVWRI